MGAADGTVRRSRGGPSVRPSDARDVTQLLAALSAGAGATYFFFCGHHARGEGEVGKWCLSQWWPAAFTIDGVSYPTTEHFMMAEKARLFGDGEAVARVLAASDPAAAKQQGRAVRGFDARVWDAERFARVVRG